MPLLEIRGLCVGFAHGSGFYTVVHDVDLTLESGKTTALVGESGSGKSVTALSIMKLIESPGKITKGTILFEGRDILTMAEPELTALRGSRIGMIFQEPMTALNPVLKCGEQVAEALHYHKKMSGSEVQNRVIELLTLAGLPDPKQLLNVYPHELSGGMRQRLMIAAALACEPALLIADEPTTALDPTVQRQILELIKDLQKQRGMAVLLITHDMGIVAEFADDVAVMYASRIVEQAEVRALFRSPKHPYTRGLLASVPALQKGNRRLEGIPGQVPDAAHFPSGCTFHNRCQFAQPDCELKFPEVQAVTPGHTVSCFFWDKIG